MNDNYSWNCGHEGDAGAPAEVLALRRKQAKNFFCLLMLSNGTPMFRAGDEFLNTQFGNNNPYNQDNATGWLDWSQLQANQDIFRFFKSMIAFRKNHPTLSRSRFWREDVAWYGTGSAADLSPGFPQPSVLPSRRISERPRHLRNDQCLLGKLGVSDSGRYRTRVDQNCRY